MRWAVFQFKTVDNADYHTHTSCFNGHLPQKLLIKYFHWVLNPTRMTSDNNNQSQAQTLHIITDTVLPSVPSTSTLCFNQLLIAIQHLIQFCQTYVQTIFINNLAFFITKLSGSSANYSLISAFFIFFFYFKRHIHLSILASVLSKFTLYVFRRRQ